MLEIGIRTTTTSFDALLTQLKQIWNEMGESESDKESMLLEMEMECLEIYRRKVEDAGNAKARLNQSIALMEAEFATLMAALGDLNDVHSPLRYVHVKKGSKSLKHKLAVITPLVEDLRRKKQERIDEFAKTKEQIEKISLEISGYRQINSVAIPFQEHDLSLRKLTEYQTHLCTLQKEKCDRFNKVLDCVNEVHSLCGVLGLDFGETVSAVHPSLHMTKFDDHSTNISNTTLQGLQEAIDNLKIERKVQTNKLKGIVASLLQLWNLMDSPHEEKSKFTRIASLVRLSESEIHESGLLSAQTIEEASAEVERLNKLKATRMKELVIKKRRELEELCRMAHIEVDTTTAAEKSNALMDSGLVDPAHLLSNIEGEIVKVKDEVLDRKDIIDRIDRWLSTCEEENWLEEYNQDNKRYSAGRGAHINLKRAERARVAVSKIPAMVNNLINRTLAWEDEKHKLFLYDGVRLVSILEDYKLTRKQRGEEKKKYRDQKKLQDLLLTERESIYGTKPSPTARRSNSFRKLNGYSINEGPVTPKASRNSLTARSYSGRQSGYFKGPVNFVSILKDDTVSSSYASFCGSDPDSPLHLQPQPQS